MYFSKEYFERSKKMYERLYSYLEWLSSNDDFLEFVKNIKGLEEIDGLPFREKLNSRITSLLMCDIVSTYKLMGVNGKQFCNEMLTFALMNWRIMGHDEVWDYENLDEVYDAFQDYIDSILSTFAMYGRMAKPFESQHNIYILDYLFDIFKPRLKEQYNDLLNDLAAFILS